MNYDSADHGRRLSSLDGTFLRMETAHAHMHVAWSAVFAAPPDDGARPTVEALRKRAAGRLHEVPWCRWKLEGAPLGLSEPRWIDDPEFDLSDRIVQHTDPGDPVSPEAFAALRSDLLSVPLDRSQPLWQIFLVPRLADGRVGMVGKIHHALVDGIAALQIVGLVVDDEPDAETQPGEEWDPDEPAGTVAQAAGALTDAAGEGVRALRDGAGAVTRPRAAARSTLSGLARVVRVAQTDLLPRAPDSSLNVPIGARRTLVGHRASRDELRAARAGGGGTPNDIGLAVVAGALRNLALRNGDPVDAPLKTMVPVSMRRADELGSGNRIAMVYLQLPIHLDSPRARMEWVREQTRRLKHSDRPAGTEAFYRLAALLPTPLRSPVARAMTNSRAFNLTVSQSPGPRGTLHLLGCELQEVYSVVPIGEGHALSIGMVRYQRELFFGCYADPEALPAIHELPGLLEAELRALADSPAAARDTAPAASSRA